MPITRPEQIDREVQRQWWQLEADLFLFLRLLDGPVYLQELMDAADLEGIPRSRVNAAQYRVHTDSFIEQHGRKALWHLHENEAQRHPLENTRCSSCSEPIEPDYEHYEHTGLCMHCHRMATE
jgi:hypothetical protein